VGEFLAPLIARDTRIHQLDTVSNPDIRSTRATCDRDKVDAPCHITLQVAIPSASAQSRHLRALAQVCGWKDVGRWAGDAPMHARSQMQTHPKS
jgi:hypothetical protein